MIKTINDCKLIIRHKMFFIKTRIRIREIKKIEEYNEFRKQIKKFKRRKKVDPR